MSLILSLFAVPLGILIGLDYFNAYSINSLLPFDVTLIGAVFLIAVQVYGYFWAMGLNQGSQIMGKVIKTVLALPGIIYLANLFYPLSLGFDLQIVIAAFLFTEGIYGLH